MKVKDIIKKQTTIIAIAVVLVAMAAMGVSYAVFFDVKKNASNQVITAGTLTVKITGSDALTSVDVGQDTEKTLTYTVSNTGGNLPSTYKVYLYADDSHNTAIKLSQIKVSFGGTTKTLTDITPSVAIDANTSAVPTGCAAKGTAAGNKCWGYQIDTGTLAKGATTGSKTLKVWVDESTVTDEISGNVSLRLFVENVVNETEAAK